MKKPTKRKLIVLINGKERQLRKLANLEAQLERRQTKLLKDKARLDALHTETILKLGAMQSLLLGDHSNLTGRVLAYEKELIRAALLVTEKRSVTKAAAMLGMGYQGLAYIIGARHKDLLQVRSPVKLRPGGRKVDKVAALGV